MNRQAPVGGTSAERRLALSVGSAPPHLRITIASVLLMIGVALGTGGSMLSAHGAAAQVFAASFIFPVSMSAVLAALFVLRPRSRFGDWLAGETDKGSRSGAPVVISIVAWVLSSVVLFLILRL